MATLNTSTNGPSISKSYQSIIHAPIAGKSISPSYAQWAVFSVSTPLVNAFQQDAVGKESVLKVQSTSDGELADLIDEFSDGKVQFAFAKVKDPNTTLPKYVLIAWCGEGVPERTKGYFTSHLAAVSKVLHGYHVQVTARSDRDLTPESIMQKVSDASGSKYSSGGPTASNLGGPPPPTSSKPAFTPTQSSRGAGSFRSSASSRLPAGAKEPVDEDGWGQDAPPVTRTELEKVQSSYQPTKVNLHDISSQKPQPSIFNGAKPENDVHEDVVKGAYQPVGKVDIAALRRQAQESGRVNDDRPSAVKGSYEPVGKVDIAAIRAKAQQPSGVAPSPPGSISPAATGASVQSSNRGGQNSSTPAHTSERLTSLPKPKVGGKFGAGANTFAGTKAPTPGEFGLESKPTPAAPPVGVGRTFADQGGKTPAQLWAEKKARERGASAAGDHLPPAGFGPPSSPIASQTSGGGDWKSGYKGKSWAPVQTTRTGQSASSMSEKATTEEEQSHEAVPSSPAGGIGAIRDRFKDTSPMGVAPEGVGHAAPGPPALDTSNKPNATRGVPIPGLPTRPLEKGPEENRMPTPPAQPPRSPTPPTPPALDPGSPIRVAMPVSRGQEPKHEVNDAREEQFSPPPAMPTRSLAQQIPHDTELTEEPSGHDPARAAGAAAAAASFGQQAADSAQPGVDESGKRALVQFDYEKAEDNELELREGEYVTNIEMVDEDWWMGQNPRGETGLFPSNYVELVEDTGDDTAPGGTHHLASEPDEEPIKHTENTAVDSGHTATALYDYEAAEDNELSFPEHAKITGIEFPDDDWWAGEYQGRQGLFPANYVQLDQ